MPCGIEKRHQERTANHVTEGMNKALKATEEGFDVRVTQNLGILTGKRRR